MALAKAIEAIGTETERDYRSIALQHHSRHVREIARVTNVMTAPNPSALDFALINGPVNFPPNLANIAPTCGTCKLRVRVTGPV